MNPAPEVPIQDDDRRPMRSVPLGDIGMKRPYAQRLICKDCGLVLHDLYIGVDLRNKGGAKYFLCLEHGLPMLEGALLAT